MVDVQGVKGVTPLLADASWEVFRAELEADSQPVLVRTPVRGERSESVALSWFEHELALRERLGTEWVVSPLERLLTEDGRPALLFTDPGGVLLGSLPRPLAPGRLLELSMMLTDALHATHQAGVLHGALSPLAILCQEHCVRLTGFAAPSLARSPNAASVPWVDANLPYLAPERTGQVRSPVDARSDLYALGILLYELATGRLPFDARDALEWTHCHVARRPTAPRELVQELPQMIEAVILKLIAKTPEDRYQSCAGLRVDLERCLREWQSEGAITPFSLGVAEFAGRLARPPRLLGRDEELAQLAGCFDRVAHTEAFELVLISGASGVGKTALVNALRSRIANRPALFLSGKFDQLDVEIPYEVVVQALTAATQHLLSVESGALEAWRDRLMLALGPNGQLLTAAIPQLELIVGPQPPPPELPPAEAKNRFSSLLGAVIAALAQPDQPLVLFLDDLQWADSASLELITSLCARRVAKHLLLVAAFREDSLAPGHPLLTWVASLESAGIAPVHLRLGALSAEGLAALTTATLECDPATGGELGRAIAARTGGNCFHFLQVLRALHEEGILRFVSSSGRWEWDANAVHALPAQANVVSLMVRRLSALPRRTRQVLTHFSCVGTVAETALLAQICDRSEEALIWDLTPALAAGLVLREANTYRFLHDRVQQAALELLPEMDRPAFHLAVARALFGDAGPGTERLFATVSQYRLGAPLLTEPNERDRVARLALTAAELAQASAAYHAALEYLAFGRRMLCSGSHQDAELLFQFRFRAAECSWLAGAAEQAATELTALLGESFLTEAWRAAVLCRLIEVTTTLGRMHSALEHCQSCLALLGIELEVEPTPRQVEAAYAELWEALGDRSIPSLIDLPTLDAPPLQLAIEAMAATIPAAVFTSEAFPQVLLCRMSALSFRNGHSAAGASGYSYLAMLLAAQPERSRAGYELGRLALDLVDKRGFIGKKPRIYVMFGNVVNLWWHPLSTCVPYVQEAFKSARVLGDLTGACYSCNHLVSTLLAMGRPLPEVDEACSTGLAFVRDAGYADVADILLSHQRLVHALQGRTQALTSFEAEDFSASDFEARIARSQMTLLRFWHGTLTVQLLVIAGQAKDAVQLGERIGELLWSSPSHVQIPEYHFYFALALAQTTDWAPGAERPRNVARLTEAIQLFSRWAEHCPANFEHKQLFLRAELARLEGRDEVAAEGYGRATQSARENGFVQVAALACERAASLHRDRGLTVLASALAREAVSQYSDWGAHGKVRQLAAQYPAVSPRPQTAGVPEVRLDHLAAIKASQALSGEIMLPRLLERLLTVALESTGAERCVLALVEDQCPVSAAEAFIVDGRVEVSLERPLAALGASLPEALFNYVLRTREALIIDDAGLPGPFAHVFHGRPERSALCLPVQSKARLLAVIYFSHDQLTRLFTAERLAFLELLAAQFAISVENARLYGWVIDENQRRTAAEERLALAVSSAELGIWDWDIRTNALRWDAQMFRIYGLSAEDAATPVRDVTLWESCVHPEDRAQVLKDLQEALSGEVTGYDTAFRVRWPDGNVRNIKAYGRVIRGSEGQPLRMLGVNQDVTERIRLEERLAQAEKLSSIGHLASGIAHNLNNQLTCVRGYAEMLLLSPLGEEQRKDAAGIISVSRRAGDLVAQLLAFARKSTLIARPVDMHQLLHETAGMLKHGLDSRIEIELELGAQPPHVLGDATQLQNALLNLGFNARDAMPIGGKLIFATQVEELEGGAGGKLGLAPGRYLRLRVTDTGIGMNAETRRRIFEPFFTTKPVGKGTGLGLASVHGTIAQHRGAIAVESALNEGTTFTVHLPLLNPEQAKPVRSRPPRPGGG